RRLVLDDPGALAEFRPEPEQVGDERKGPLGHERLLEDLVAREEMPEQMTARPARVGRERTVLLGNGEDRVAQAVAELGRRRRARRQDGVSLRFEVENVGSEPQAVNLFAHMPLGVAIGGQRFLPNFLSGQLAKTSKLSRQSDVVDRHRSPPFKVASCAFGGTAAIRPVPFGAKVPGSSGAPLVTKRSTAIITAKTLLD